MKKISVLMLLAFSMLTFGAFAETNSVSKSSAKTELTQVKKHPKKHAKKHKGILAKKKK